jgi:2-methylisocitrate lyase-like PEP mutase family enzyme
MAASDRVRQFRELHERGTFVLPNAWDAASAALVAQAGARAVATTSSGISWANGVPDGNRMTRHAMIEAIARIVRSVAVPVSGDIESGYGQTPSDVGATVETLASTGAVGANIEDRPGPSGQTLWPTELQCERLAAARAAAERHVPGFVLNARTDVFLAEVGEPDEREDMVLTRAEAFADAGADCFFVPRLTDLNAIGRIARRSPLPINVLLAPGRGPTVGELAAAGVRRISIGGGLAVLAYGAARRAARDLLSGDDERLGAALTEFTHGDMQSLMEVASGRERASTGDSD